MKLFVLEGIKKMCHLEEVLSRKTHISWVTPLTLGWEWFVEHLRQRDTERHTEEKHWRRVK